MQVLSGHLVNLATDQAPAASTPRVSPRPSAPPPSSPASPELQAARDLQTNAASGVKLEPLLTIHRDPAGRMYYVISDAQSGKEIAQLPPEQLRNIGEGIAEFLKQQEAKNAEIPHIVTEG